MCEQYFAERAMIVALEQSGLYPFSKEDSVPVFTCPRCEMGQLNSEHGKLGVCWYCSNYRASYVCEPIPGHANSTGCGMIICADDLRKVLAQKAAPAKKPEFKPGNPEEDAL